MSKEEIVKAIETRLEMLVELVEETKMDELQAKENYSRIDELETLLDYIENPRIK